MHRLIDSSIVRARAAASVSCRVMEWTHKRRYRRPLIYSVSSKCYIHT